MESSTEYKTRAETIRDLKSKIWTYEQHILRNTPYARESDQYRLWVRMLAFLTK
jgi:hypothetical protein